MTRCESLSHSPLLSIPAPDGCVSVGGGSRVGRGSFKTGPAALVAWWRVWSVSGLQGNRRLEDLAQRGQGPGPSGHNSAAKDISFHGPRILSG